MTAAALLYAVGAVLEGWLAAMLFLSGRRLRGPDERWTLLLATGFALNAFRSATMTMGVGNVAFNRTANVATSTFAEVALALITGALLHYVGMSALARRRFWLVVGPVIFAAWVLTTTGVINRGGAFVFAIVVIGGWVRAHQRTLREGERTAQALAAGERAVNESLEQRVAQRTSHLGETIAGLESFNRSVSHDLRGPLGGISGVARIARDKLGEGLLDEADAMMAVIVRQADDSVAMVSALLELARAGNAEPQRGPVDATALAGEVVATGGGLHLREVRLLAVVDLVEDPRAIDPGERIGRALDGVGAVGSSRGAGTPVG